MEYYIAENNPVSPLYEKEGTFYPVFVEKYGTEPVEAGMVRKIDDPETVEALDKYMTPYEDGKKKIYMAGPLFNEGDRYTNQRNSDILREKGFSTFLPQEIVITDESSDIVKAGCFFMDLKAIKQADYIIANCNGIEIDSGTAAEIGLSYALGKKTILYKSDVRNYFNSYARLNNFVAGLVDNKVYSSIEEVIAALD